MNEPPDSPSLPEKCRQCAKSSAAMIYSKCEFCREIGFKEEVLCDLNRRAQASLQSFECHAFQPALKLLGAETSCKVVAFPESRQNRPPENALRKILDSDKYKYQYALARQKIVRSPDDLFMEIKYHLAWNVACRNPIFEFPANSIDGIIDIFTTYDVLAGGFACLLWLAPDHIHLYIDSDGEKSVESIAQNIKRQSAQSILAQLPDLKPSLHRKKTLWDKAYFVETIG